MNYEAGAHEAQMNILRELLMAKKKSFVELQKASGLTSDHVNFHIKKLIEAGYVEHKPKSYGDYQLTIQGKEYANRMDTDVAEMERQPKLSVIVIVENNEGRFLCQQRLKQPFYGFWGSMTGKIRWGETVLGAAARELKEETGLVADLTPVGLYHKMDYDQTSAILEDKYLCIVYGKNPRGEFLSDTEGHHNEWLIDEEFEKKDLKFDAVLEIRDIARSGQVVVIEKKHQYEREEY